MFFFFFSSRRRHTRWNCDWSSDVCSSDLPSARRTPPGRAVPRHRRLAGVRSPGCARRRRRAGSCPAPVPAAAPVRREGRPAAFARPRPRPEGRPAGSAPARPEAEPIPASPRPNLHRACPAGAAARCGRWPLAASGRLLAVAGPTYSVEDGRPCKPVPPRAAASASVPLAGGAEGGAAAAEDDLLQRRAAAGAREPRLAVGDQEARVAPAVPVDHPVVAEGGALAGDGLFEDLADGG